MDKDVHPLDDAIWDRGVIACGVHFALVKVGPGDDHLKRVAHRSTSESGETVLSVSESSAR